MSCNNMSVQSVNSELLQGREEEKHQVHKVEDIRKGGPSVDLHTHTKSSQIHGLMYLGIDRFVPYFLDELAKVGEVFIEVKTTGKDVFSYVLRTRGGGILIIRILQRQVPHGTYQIHGDIVVKV